MAATAACPSHAIGNGRSNPLSISARKWLDTLAASAWSRTLIRVLASGGEGAAGQLVAKLGAKAEITRLAREDGHSASQPQLFQ